MTDQQPRKPMGRRPTGIQYPHKDNVMTSTAQHDWLVAEAARRGITIGALIRQLIDEARKTCTFGQVDRQAFG